MMLAARRSTRRRTNRHRQAPARRCPAKARPLATPPADVVGGELMLMFALWLGGPKTTSARRNPRADEQR